MCFKRRCCTLLLMIVFVLGNFAGNANEVVSAQTSSDYRISNAGFTCDGTPTTSLNKGLVGFSVNIQNNISEAKDAVVIMMLYEGDKLINIDFMQQSIGGGSTLPFELEFNVNSVQSNSVVKAFIWESMESMIPMSPTEYKLQNLRHDKAITSFTFDTPQATGEIDEANKYILVEVPKTTVLSLLTPTIQVSPGATVSPASGVVQNFAAAVTYTVTAEDGTSAAYTVDALKSIIYEDFTSGAVSDSGWALTAPAAAGTLSVEDDPLDSNNKVWKFDDISNAASDNRIMAVNSFGVSLSKKVILEYKVMYNRGTYSAVNNILASGVELQGSSTSFVGVIGRDQSVDVQQIGAISGASNVAVTNISLNNWYKVKVIFTYNADNTAATVQYFINDVEYPNVANSWLTASFKPNISSTRITTSTSRIATMYIDNLKIIGK